MIEMQAKVLNAQTRAKTAEAHAQHLESRVAELQRIYNVERKTKEKAQVKGKALYRAYRQSLAMIHLLTSEETVHCSGDAKWRQVPIDEDIADPAAWVGMVGSMSHLHTEMKDGK